MSKIKLKKVLAELDAEQLRGLVLDLYTARKEVRGWLDFYAEPDPEQELEKSIQLAYKEWMRAVHSRRGRQARISLLRGIVRDFKSLAPGDEYVARLLTGMVMMAMDCCNGGTSTAVCEGTAKMAIEAVETYVAAGIAKPELIPALRKRAMDLPRDYYGNRREMALYMLKALQECEQKYQ